MPGNINDIIDVEGSITAINKVADRLVGLDTQIDEMNKNPVVVKVDTGGIDTLAEINASIQKLNEKINQNTQIVAENKSVVQQMNQIQTVYGESTRDNAERLVKLKIELEDVTASMKETQTMMKAGVGDYEKGIRLLAGYTEKQAELTLSIKETQKAIADQVKSNSAFEGSVKSARAEITLLNREQENLIVVRRKGLDITDEELVANIKRRDAIIAEKNALHDFIKANADANLARVLNIGNYPQLQQQLSATTLKMEELTAAGKTNTAEFKEMEAEAVRLKASMAGVFTGSTSGGATGLTSISSQLSATKAQMQQLVVAGKQDSAEFERLSIEANKLSAAMREVARETGRATFSLENVGKRLETSFFRMALHFVEFTVLIEGIMKAVEWMSKLTDAEELQKQKLEELTETTKAYAKTVSEMSANINANTEIEIQKSKSLVGIMTDMTQPIEARTDAYNKLLSTMPGLFHGMTQEQALSEKNIQTIRAHADAITSLSTTINETAKTRDQAQRLLSSLEESQTAVERTYSGTSKDPNKAKTEQINQLRNDIKGYNNDIEQQQAKLARINSPDLKVIKDKKDNAKDLNAQLIAEENRYKAELALAQKAFDEKEKLNAKAGNNEAVTYTHQQELSAKQRQAEIDHYQIAEKIMQAHYGKTGETANQWNERVTKYALSQIEEENKIAENEGRNTEKFKADQQAKIDAIEAFRKKYEENKLKMQAIDNEIAAQKEKAAVEHKYAGGAGGFLEGLGINPNEQAEKDKQFAIDRELAQKKEAAAYNAALNTTNELESQQHVIDAKNAAKEINAIDIAQQKSHDEVILDAKRKIGEETIQLAQQVADTLATIRNNQFAAEQQQLQYEQQQLQIHSQQKIQAINATAGYQITKDNEVARVTAQTAAQQNELIQKQNALALKKAKADKEAAEAGILLNTALGIAKVIGSGMLAGPSLPFGLAEIALITAIGAAQYAAAASTPLPQFKEGTPESGTWTKNFIAGEGNKAELGVTPQGQTMLFDKEGVYTAPLGTKIFSNPDTERIINYAVNSSGKLEAMPVVNHIFDDKNIIEELKNNTEAVIKSAMMKQPIRNTIIVNSYNPLQRPKK